MSLLLEISGLLGPLVAPWKEFGNVLKGELKRTIVNMNTLLQVSLGPTLSRADYAKVMKKNKEKIDKIDSEVNAALDKIPVGNVGKAMLWTLAPGPMVFKTVRDISGTVTPEAVENFMDEYGFKDLAIGSIPVGRIVTGVASKGAKLGGFATLNRKAYDKSMKEYEEDAEDKWYTPIERILLLQNPFKPGPGAGGKNENYRSNGSLLLEADQKQDEEKAFLDTLRITGFEGKYLKQTVIPYVEAKTQMIEGIIDLFEKEIEETASIVSAQTFGEFVDALSKTTVEKFKQINAGAIKSNMEKEVDTLMQDKENFEKFVAATGAKIEDLQKDKNKAKEFIAQKIYEKEFTEMRINSITSIVDAVDEIKEVILGDYPEKDLEQLKINAPGKQLYDVITDALERLKTAAADIEDLANEAKKLEK